MALAQNKFRTSIFMFKKLTIKGLVIFDYAMHTELFSIQRYITSFKISEMAISCIAEVR